MIAGMRLRLFWCLAAAGVALSAAALGPHELLVLVNPDSPESLAIANRFVELRGVPPENVVCLPLPPSASEAAAEITPEDFSTYIWAPATEAMRKRGLEGHTLAWIFSAGFPARLKTAPPVSLPGAVFARNQLPPADQVATGLYASVLFRGPTSPGGEEVETISLDLAAAGFGPKMPLPSMMLGWTGARGLTLEESLAVLDRGAASDGTRPGGPVYLLTNGDIRSRCRDWQFARAAEQMADRGMRGVSGPQFPSNASGVAGLMIGTADPPVGDIHSWAPGAFAEHLTSYAADFQQSIQTKLTEWLRAGATCSAGAVAEPYAVWTKFPSARIFAHLGAGATMLEALAQSVASPMQLLAVGDPLACPWGHRMAVTLEGPDEVKDSAMFRGHAPSDHPVSQWLFLLDGRVVATGVSPEFSLNSAALMPGAHTLRAVAYGDPPVRAQGWAERTIRVPSAHEPATLQAVENRVAAHAPGAARILLYHWGRRVAELSGAEAEWIPRRSIVGAGKISLDAVAQYPDGSVARSARLWVDIPARRPPPDFSARMKSSAPPTAEIQIGASAPSAISWRIPALERGLMGYRLPKESSVSKDDEAAASLNGTLRLTPGVSNEVAVVRWPVDANRRRTEFAAVARWTDEPPRMPRHGAAALVWGNPADGPLKFFGMLGTSSAWAWGDIVNGRMNPRATIGAPLRTGTPYRLSVRLSDDRKFVECRVEGRVQFRVPAGTSEDLGAPGLAAGKDGAEFKDIQFGAAIPPSAIRSGGQSSYAVNLSYLGTREATCVLTTEDDETCAPLKW